MERKEFLSTRCLMERYDVSMSTIGRWHRQGVLPPPLRLGNLLRWRAADIDKWEAENIDADPSGKDAPIYMDYQGN